MLVCNALTLGEQETTIQIFPDPNNPGSTCGTTSIDFVAGYNGFVLPLSSVSEFLLVINLVQTMNNVV